MKASEQASFWDDKPKPRQRPRVMMHVIDAGPGEQADGSHLVRMRCKKCGQETEWFEIETITEGRRGKPCPKCNEVITHESV